MFRLVFWVLRRLVWLTAGAGIGFGAAMYLLVRARGAAARLTPGGVSSELAASLRHLGDDLRAAALEGRVGMREAERRWRAQLEPVPRGRVESLPEAEQRSLGAG